MPKIETTRDLVNLNLELNNFSAVSTSPPGSRRPYLRLDPYFQLVNISTMHAWGH